MSENITKVRGTTESFKNDKGGAVTRNYPVVGVVKNNIDSLRSGRIQVALDDVGGQADSNSDQGWISVAYLSPFYGQTSPSGSGGDYGGFVGNPHSYGFWGTAPDVGTKVLIVFMDGDINKGYCVGCIPEAGSNHMVPAMGAATNITANGGEAESYGGATRLPVTEINTQNPKIAGSSQGAGEARPVHSYQAAILNKQGLLRDPDRGTIGSSAMRESPSRVFGFSTPGRPIYEGGFTDETIKSSSGDASPDKLKVAGRRGGHSLVMDDGDVSGADQLLRLRTAGGHQIMMNDTADTLFIIHANGQSYVELGKEGTVDIYSTNSFNVRTQGDLNLHADNNINIHATKNLNIHGENIVVESDKATSVRSGSTFAQYTMGAHTVKGDAGMSFAAGGEASLSAGGAAFVNGSKVNLNSGSSGLTPATVNPIPPIAHADTLYDNKVGYAPAPGHLKSTVSRAPAHSPWSGAGQGVDVATTNNASAKQPSTPSAGVQAANNAAPATPSNPVSPAVAASVPPTNAASSTMDKNTTSALVGQSATNAANGPGAAATTNGAALVGGSSPTTSTPPQAANRLFGIEEQQFPSASLGAESVAIGKFAQNPAQLVQAGILKPGADKLVNAAIASGKTIDEALPKNLFTGKEGIKDLSSYVQSTGAQVNAQVSILGKAESELKVSGAITGKESPTQTAGLVMGAAAIGTSAILSFANKVGGSGLGLSMPKLPDIGNMNLGSPSDLLSSGKFAAGFADKVTSGLGSLTGGSSGNPLDALKGAAATAFSKITASFKPMKPGVPQNLTKLKAEADATAAAADVAGESAAVAKAGAGLGIGSGLSLSSLSSSVSGAITTASASIGSMVSSANGLISGAKTSGINALPSSTDISSKLNLGSIGLGGLAGGVGAAGSIVSKAQGAMTNPLSSIPALSSLTATATGAVAGVTGTLSGITDSAKSLTSKILDSKTSLTNVASSGLGAGALAKMNASISSLASAGPNSLKLPTAAVDTSDTAALQAQSAALLGDSRVPPLKFGAVSIPKPTVQQANDAERLSASLATEEEKVSAARKALDAVKDKFGPDSAITKAAENTYKLASQKVESIQNDLSKLA